MRRLLLLLLLSNILFLANAQDIVLSFQGQNYNTGEPIALDKVLIENLSRGGEIELTNTFEINLTETLSNGSFVIQERPSGFSKIYPNPFLNTLNIEFHTSGKGHTKLAVFNILGQEVMSFNKHLNYGKHSFIFSPNANGIYFLRLTDNDKTYIQKVIAYQSNKQLELVYSGRTKENKDTYITRDTQAVFFELGDLLRFTGEAGSNIETLYNSPTQSQLYTFEFLDHFAFTPYLIQESQPNFVDIIYAVTDQDNQGVDYLTSNDFNVLEDGNPVSPSETFRCVKKLGEVDYQQKIVLMLDNSVSVQNDLPQIKASAITLVNQILNNPVIENQEIAIYSFSSSPTLEEDFTSNIADLENAINSIELGFPSTNLYGSLITGLNSFNNTYSLDLINEGYLIALTDGDDTQGSSTLNQVLNARANKRVFMIGLGNEINPGPLNQIHNTSNTYIAINNVSELEAAFENISLEIIKYANSFYWLNYSSPKRGGSHTLTVEIPGNLNPGPNEIITGSFSAAGFQDVVSGVYANITAANVYGVDWVSRDIADTNPIEIIAYSYWANDCPMYTWSIADETIATLEIDPNNNSKALIISQTNEVSSTVLTLTDTANNYTKEITIYITGELPTVITNQVEDITNSSATFSAEVIDEGNTSISERGIVWSTNPNPTISSNKIIDGGIGTGEYSSNVTALNAAITYYVRSYVVYNSSDVTYGNEVDFTTENGLPNVITLGNSNITTTTVILNGEVISDGGFPIINRGFVWSTSPNPTLTDEFNIEGNQIGIYISNLANLADNTTYYARAYATNSFGTAYGNETTFTTINFIYNGSLILYTQDNVESFGALGITTINGTLQIGNFTNTDSILNLNALSSLTNVANLSIINNNLLANLNGLNNAIINSSIIENNSSLIDLSALHEVSSLQIRNNDALTILSGVFDPIEVQQFLGIYENDSLETIGDLNFSNSPFGSIQIMNNENLTNLDGIIGLTEITSDLVIRENPNLLNLNSMTNLNIIGGNLSIINNMNLNSLNGLNNVTSISAVFIDNNSNLLSLDGLNNLIFVGAYLNITNNSNLVDFCGLTNLLLNGGLITATYSVINNAFNPTATEIYNGDCSQ